MLAVPRRDERGRITVRSSLRCFCFVSVGLVCMPTVADVAELVGRLS